MATYQAHSVGVVSTVKNMTRETYETIGKLDKACRAMAKVLDKKMEEISSTKSVSKESLHEADLLRKALETLSASKYQLAIRSYDLLDQKIKIVDHEIALLEKALTSNGEEFELEYVTEKVRKGLKDKGTSKKKRKHEDSSESSSPDQSTNNNVPIYCICKQPAFGDMVGCDNENCEVEWYHYPCVNLTRPPKNKWLCPTCTQMKRNNKL